MVKSPIALMTGAILILVITLSSILLFEQRKETIVGQASMTSMPPQQILTTTGKIYVYGTKLIATKNLNGITYHLQNSIDTNTITLNQEGRLQSKYTSYPFGKTLTKESFAGTTQKYTFTGKEDDGKLMYYGARYYDTRTGRFLGTDPLLSSPSSYSYSGDNPLHYIDPDGRSLFDAIKNHWRPVATTLAIGTITYNLGRGERATTNTAGKLAAGVLALDAGIASLSAVGNLNVNLEQEQYAATPSKDRLTYGQIKPYNDFIRNSGVEGAGEVADVIEKKARDGLIFSSTFMSDDKSVIYCLTPIENINNLQPDSKIKGYAVSNVYANIPLFPGFIGHTDPRFGETVSILSHEGKHLTQHPLRNIVNNFFGFSYWSKNNLNEEPARKFQDKIDAVWSEPEPGQNNVDPPAQDNGPSLA